MFMQLTRDLFAIAKFCHRLRGSNCTVLTATGLVNGEGQILTPYRIETPEPIAKNCTRG